jgi:16S rRNA G966 N2-methylase RsmD
MTTSAHPTDDFPTGLTDAERRFVREHLLDDPSTLLLHTSPAPDLDVRKVVRQIAARQKARTKLPDWYQREELLFPPPLSVEQGSSQATALYKAGLMSGTHLIDITGGMGVDCYYMSRSFARTTYFEQQPEVARSAAYNFGVLGANQITVRNEEALEALRRQPLPQERLPQERLAADCLYADPARRDDQQRKVVQLADCTPDVVTALPLLLACAPRVLVKTSPLLDIDLTIKDLAHVREVHVLGLDSECKEVLYLLDRDLPAGQEPQLMVRLLGPEGQPIAALDFTRASEAAAPVPYGEPLRYLYEPHAALLKAGAFRSVASQYGLVKLAPSSHLYTSDAWLPDFPGRGFAVTAMGRPDARELLPYLPDGKANLTVRNFPATVQELRKKWKVKEGGSTYLFATTLSDGRKVVVVCQKQP